MFKGLKSEVKDVDSKGVITLAANAIGNIDSQKDISLSGSFDKTIAENFSRMKWFLNHDTNILLGVPITAKENNNYLQVQGQLNMKKQVSLDIYEDYKLYAEHGRTLEHSIGVDAVKFTMKGDIRQVSEWKWWEFSTLTSWGANSDTPLLGLKSCELDREIDWLELKMRKGNFSDEKFTQIQKHLEILKALSKEPGLPTLHDEPHDFKGLADVINQFTKTLNS